MVEKTKKRMICIQIRADLFQEVNMELVKKHGNSFGHFTKTIEQSLEEWLKNQKIESSRT